MALPLDQIPGYAGYMQRQQDNEKRSLAELMQVGKIQEMLMQQQGMDMQRQKFARENEAFAREGQYRSDVQALGMNPTQEQIAAVAARYASPSDLLTTQQKSLDRKATLEAAAMQAVIGHQNKLEEIKTRVKEQGEQQRQIAELNNQFRRDMAQLTASMRQPQAPVAVADPKDPTRAIYVAPGQAYGMRPAPAAGGDMGKPPAGYRWKPDGSLEQIPGGPADAKTQQRMEGGSTVDSLVAGLRDIYDQLDKDGGITNPQKGALGNAAAWASSSAAGQFAGRIAGTENQSRRNMIAQQRPLLLQAIMKATGMSAKQMDSNTELKLYLATATDPTLDVAANKAALAKIEELYGSKGAKIGSNATVASDPRTVMLPDGRTKTFPTPAAADAFRKAAGL